MSQLRPTAAQPADPSVGEHGVPAQEVGVLGGVDVVGQHRQRDLIAQLAAQRGHQSGLTRTHRPADADAQRLTGLPHPLGPVGMGVRFSIDEMWWHIGTFRLSS